MAATTCIYGETLLLVNVYAPTDHDAREFLFTLLGDVLQARDGPVLVGENFNCTIIPAEDRTILKTAASHFSPQLLRMTERGGLEDVLLGKRHGPKKTGTRQPRHETWVKEIDRRVPTQPFDHDAAIVRLMPPAGAQAAAELERDAQVGDTVDPRGQAEQCANRRDSLKAEVAAGYVQAVADSKLKLRNAQVSGTSAPAENGVCEEELSLEGSALREYISHLKEEWQEDSTLRRRIETASPAQLANAMSDG
ncbi:hypothetical protein PybrP1_001597 [[Pythium] brassicae (nom. inval.)]|nr:hypothetical protein PybrP1_001597 [[Pythium] brassicae (nom. inval.)]